MLDGLSSWLPGAELLEDQPEKSPEPVDKVPGPDNEPAPVSDIEPATEKAPDAHIMGWAGLASIAEESPGNTPVPIASIDTEKNHKGEPLPEGQMTRAEFFKMYFCTICSGAVMIPPHLASLSIQEGEEVPAREASDALYNIIDRSGGAPLLLQRGNGWGKDLGALFVFAALKYQLVRAELAERAKIEAAKQPAPEPTRKAQKEARQAVKSDPTKVVEFQTPSDPTRVQFFERGDQIPQSAMPAEVVGVFE